MKIALIYPRITDYPDFTSLRIYRKNVGIYPPLSLAYVAAVIEKAAHKVIIIDANALNLTLYDIIDRLKSFSPDILGFTATTITFYHLLFYIRQIKRKLNLPVLLGGALIGLYPEEIMRHEEIDYALIGEAESNLEIFLSIFERGGDLRQVSGLCMRREGEIVINRTTNVIRDIDSVPFPARHLLPNRKYYSFLSDRKNFTAMITSRGCLFKCIYCSLLRRLQLRSVKNVVDEIEECYRYYNVRDIDFYDSTFTIDRDRTVMICQEIIRRGLSINWTVRTRIELVNRELLREMAKAGCSAVMYGIESSNEEILRKLGRPIIDKIQIRNVIRWTNEAGMSALGFFMLGAPGETEKTMNNTIQFSKRLHLDYAQFTRITPFPGTELYEMYKKEYKEDYWRDCILSGMEARKILSPVGCGLSAQSIIRYVNRAHLRFYLSPSYLIRIIFRLKSVRQLFKFVKAAIDLLFLY